MSQKGKCEVLFMYFQVIVTPFTYIGPFLIANCYTFHLMECGS